MDEVTLVDLIKGTLEDWQKFFEDPLKYARLIKQVVCGFDPEARVILFGSAAKGLLKPSSDIDVLVVTSLAEDLHSRVKLRIKVKEALGHVTPIELHVVTPREFQEWYSRFLDVYVEV